MRIAFGIENLFAGGGLQRDCIDIAKLVQNCGHDVVIHTARDRGDAPVGDVPVVVLENGARSNHRKQYQFSIDFLRHASHGFDLKVGFGKLLGLDVLYCADPSMLSRVLQSPFLTILPRYRTYMQIEKESFARGRKTEIMLISETQMAEYVRAWNTEPGRLRLLPPILMPARRKPEHRHDGTREILRAQLDYRDEWVWLAIGVQPRVKGFDRVVKALVEFPQARLLIAGLSRKDKHFRRLAWLARRLGVLPRIDVIGHREDIVQLMSAADLLVHPARYDTAGMVILEAVVNGLPAIATAACGYASHVVAANAGIVIDEPFDIGRFVAALRDARDAGRRAQWSQAGIDYGRNPHLYEGKQTAVDIILNRARANTGMPAEATPAQTAAAAPDGIPR